MQQLARAKRGQGDGAEHQKIIAGLHFGPLTRAVAFGQQGCGTNEAKIPAHAQQHQGTPEVAQTQAHQCQQARGTDHRQPQGGDAALAKALDQLAGEKTRPKHGQHMPLDAQCGLAHAVTAANHGHGRGSHQKGHQAIAHHPGAGCDDELGCACNLAQGPGAFSHAGLGCRRQAQAPQKRQGEQSEHRLAVKAARKRGGGQGIARPNDHLRANDGGQQATQHHARNRAGLLRRLTSVHGGKAVALYASCIEPSERGAQAEQPKV